MNQNILGAKESDRIVFNKGMQGLLIKKAILMANTEKELSLLTNIPESSIYQYKTEKSTIPVYRLKSILKILEMDLQDISEGIIKTLPQDWGRKKGGINCYLKKKKEGTFDRNLKLLKQGSSLYTKQWHKEMREKDPESYYKMQYERFKKIGGYKYKTEKNEKVRNILEKKIADYLSQRKISYEYEPFVMINEKAYFPDFKVKDTIIEATMWRGNLKIDRLIEKQKAFTKEGYKFLVVVTESVKKYYKNKGFSLTTDVNQISKAI